MRNYGVFLDEDALVNAKGVELTNFAVRKETVFFAAENNSTPEMMRIEVLHLGQRHTVDLDLHDPKLFQQIQRAIPTCKILKSGICATIEAYILELQKESQPRPTPLYFRQHGVCRLANGEYVFVAGDEVLGPPPEQKWAISLAVSRAHLAYSKELSCAQAVKAMWKILERDGDVVLPIWGFTLMSSVRSQMSQVDITTYPALLVTGKQSYGKSTVCERFGLLFNDTTDTKHGKQLWAGRDMGSTPASTIEAISQYRDQVAVMDDRPKSISSAEMLKRTVVMAQALRFACNDTISSKFDQTGEMALRSCTCGAMFTSEFDLDNPSDIGRTITVRIRQEMQGGDPHDRTVAATTFRYFLLWLLPKLDTAIADLKEHLRSIQGASQRLAKNRMMILWALCLFIDFVRESGALADQDLDSMYTRAEKILDDILDDEIEQIARLENAKNISYYLLEGIRTGAIEKISRKKVQKDEELPPYYYVHLKNEDSVIYISTEVLCRYLTNHTPLQFSSEKAMDKKLYEENIIERGPDGRAASKRIDNKRYLRIRHADLVAATSKVSS